MVTGPFDNKSFAKSYWQLILGWFKWSDKPVFVIFPRKCFISKKVHFLTKMKRGVSRHNMDVKYIHPKQFAIARLKGWL